jgi:hypothetical protein
MGQEDQNQSKATARSTSSDLQRKRHLKTTIPCRSWLASEALKRAAFILLKRAIVNDLREQARSHIWTVYACERLVGCQAAFAGKPAPTGRALARLLLILI